MNFNPTETIALIIMGCNSKKEMKTAEILK